VRFEFATATRIVFGSGVASQLPELARAFGQRALVVTGRSTDRSATLVAALEHNGIECAVFSVDGEPAVDVVRSGATEARERRCELVIGIGGGSAIDAGKAIAALAANSGDPLDYLEVIGKGNALKTPPLPFLAVPTTAGTGAEVTRNAVIGSAEHGVKASMRSPMMLPEIAVVDPELTLDVPPDITASTGLDALTQLIEPYVSVRANAMTDLFCLEGMRLVAKALPAVHRNGRDREAREAMSFAALLGGLALSNAGLGVVHGFAAPIGGMFNAPHGAVCAAVLPHGMAANIRAVRERQPGGEAMPRYRKIAEVLTGDARARPTDGVKWVLALCGEMGVRTLSSFGVAIKDTEMLADKAAKANSMKSNPIALTSGELIGVVKAAI
jgi:alcohol dehydrogenase class IV